MTNQPQSQPPFPPIGPWAVRRDHGGATAALVLGILGLSFLPGLGVVAWVVGAKALQEIDADPQAGWTNRDHANIGRILGIVGTVLFVGMVLVVVCYFGFFFSLIAANA